MSNIYRIQVHFGDTDAAGIVYYPNFYRWMDQATHDFFKEKGFTVSKMEGDTNVFIPTLEANCIFKEALFHDDEVEIHSKVLEIKNKVIKIEHNFFRRGDLVAVGYEVRAWAYKQNNRLKATVVPRNVIEVLQA